MPRQPSLMGLEVSGEINAVGPDVDGFAPGDGVSFVHGYGAACHYGYYGLMSEQIENRASR